MKSKFVMMNKLLVENTNNSRVIAMVNNKGGCGKTTTGMALGLYYVRSGKNVLFIDADPQSNLTQRMGLSDEKSRDCRIGEIFRNAHIDGYYRSQSKNCKIVEYPYIYRLDTKNVSRIGQIGLIAGEHSAEIEADAAERRLLNDSYLESDQRNLVSYFKKCIDFYRDYFDIIIIDTAPALEGNVLNRVSIACADEVICPIDGLEAATGLYQLMTFIGGQTKEKHPNMLFTMIKYQNDPSCEVGVNTEIRNNVYMAMKATFGKYVCDFGVKEQPRLRRESPMFGKYTDYMTLCREIVAKISIPRDNIFGVVSREKFEELEKVLRDIGNKVREKNPEFKNSVFK